MPVLKWIAERLEGTANAEQTVLGAIPKFEDIAWAGLSYSQASYKTLTEIDASHWQQELPLHGQLLAKLGDKLPTVLQQRYRFLTAAIGV